MDDLNIFLEAATETFDSWLDGLSNNGVEKIAYDALRKHASHLYGCTEDSALAKMYALFVSGVTIGTDYLENEEEGND